MTQGRWRYIGRAVPRTDAIERVTGRALYGADQSQPNMLYGQVLRSPHPHARILQIDASRALQLEGVKAVVTAADLPPAKDRGVILAGELTIGLDHLRQLVLARDKVLFEGHAVAAVAAATPDIAEQALELIEVEYGVLPHVDDALQAMAHGAPLLHDNLFTRTIGPRPQQPSNIATIIELGWGNLEKGFAEADLVVEQSYQTQMVHQGYLEPQATVASHEPSGTLVVWTATQGTFAAQGQLAALLDLPAGKINVVPAEVGGAFGGKICVSVEPLAALLSMKTGRPVKIVLDRSEVFRACGPCSSAYITVKVGAKRDGSLTACYGKLVMDAGAFPGAPIGGAAIVSFAPYRMPHFRLECYDVVTNKPKAQPYRAPGATPMAFAVESTMDTVSHKLGMDPLAFRKLNAVGEGDQMPNGQRYNRVGLKRILEAIESHPCWTSPLEGNNRGRGLALGFWPGVTLTSSAEVLVNLDGSVAVITGQVDLTGTRTSMAQIAADMLQLPLEWVSARTGDTESTMFTDLSGGSRTTHTQSAAIHTACEDVLAQMKRLAAERLSRPEAAVSPEAVDYAEGRFWARHHPEETVPWKEVAATARVRGPVLGRGSVSGLERAPAFAAHVVDVEVDPDTGKMRPLRHTCFQDVGRAINPLQIEGQMQGGAAQGIGWALFEQCAWDQGRLLNHTLQTYLMPTAGDVPPIDCVIVAEPASSGPYGARGVGEAPIVPPVGAIANAIYRAAGVRLTRLPMTPEAVSLALSSAHPLGKRPRGRNTAPRRPYHAGILAQAPDHR